MLRAVIWDVDGTLAETERDGHRLAFNEAFSASGLPWVWSVHAYGGLLRTAGGYERLLRFMADRDDVPESAHDRASLAQRIHRLKNDAYADIVRQGQIPLRAGVVRIFDECSTRGVAMGIATTTGRHNVDALLTAHLGRGWPERFATVVCAEEAPRKKPDPLAYRLACERLGVGCGDAIAIEDSPNGLAASRALGIATLITRSVYFRDDDFPDAAAVCDDLDSPVETPDGAAARVDLDVLAACLPRSFVN